MRLFVALLGLLMFSACINNETRISTETFYFTAAVDQTTLQQVNELTLQSFRTSPSKTYLVSNTAELQSLNAILPLDQQLVINDLSAFSYFYIYGPTCPDYYRYKSNNYDGAVLSIELERVIQGGQGGCGSTMNDVFYVFKAHK